MRRCGVWLLLVLLAGCSWGEPSGNSAEAVCRRQAYDDPVVKQLIIDQMGEGGASPQSQFDYEKALHDATDACLRKKGVAVKGGVEPVRPY